MIPTMGPIYGEEDKELVFDPSVMRIQECEVMELQDEVDEVTEAFHEASFQAQWRMMQVQTAFITAYGNYREFKADGGFRLWLMAMGTALIWEMG